MAGTDQGNSPGAMVHIVAAAAGVVAFLLLWMAFSVNTLLSFVLGLVVGVGVFMIMSRMQAGDAGAPGADERMPSATKPPSATVPPATATPVAKPLSGVTKQEERKPASAEPEASAPEAPAPQAPSEAPAVPTAPQAETPRAPDDLKRINGIGPVIEKKLNAMGVQHFHQIASWSEADIARIDEQLNFKGRVTREDWVSQARALADGSALD